MTRLLLVAAALVAVLAAAFFCPTAAAAFYANPDADVQIVGLPEQVYAGGESFFIVVLANDQPFFDESLDEEGAVGVRLNITNGIVTAIEGSTFETNTSVGYDNITLYQDYISELNCTLAVIRFAPTGAGDAVHINVSGWIKDKDKPLFSDRYVATDSDDAMSEIIDYSNLYDVSTLSELALQRKAFYNNSIKMLGAIVGDGSIDSQVNMAWFGAIMWTESLSYTLLTVPTTPVELMESFDEYTNLETYSFGLDTVFMSIESIIDQMWTVTQYTGKVSDAQNELHDLEDALTHESEYWTARNENGLEDVFGWDDCASGWLRGEELILERANENLMRVIYEAKKDIDAGTSDEADLYAYNVAKTALAFGENDLKYVRSVRDELPVDSDGDGLFDFENKTEPIPSLTNLEPSIEIAVGETRDLVFTLTNAGNDSDVGYLDLSVSSGIEIVANSSDAADMLNYTLAPGKDAYFSDGELHPLTHSLFGAYKPYAEGESVTVTITIEATAAGEQWLKYRLSMLNSSGEYIRIPNAGVKDQQGWYAHETTVTVIDPANVAPAADAGCDQEVSEGTAVTLNGSGSSDTDGEVARYVWREGGSVIGMGSVIGRTFSAGTHPVVLTVTDCGGKSDSDTVVVTVTANAAPVADAGCDQSVVSGAVVTLDGSGSSDSDGAIEYYEWQEDGVFLGSGATLETVFAPGVHEITLYVVDDGGKVGSDEVGVEVAASVVPEEEWNVTFGGADDDVAYSVQQTTDGGYVLAGFTGSYGAGGIWDFWLVKTDLGGNHEWDRTFGGTSSDFIEAFQQTSDGGYILAGFTGSYGAGVSDFWLVKTDSDGNHEWNKTFGGTSCDWASSVQETSDGGYIIAGDTWSYGAGVSDFWLVKTDSDGNHEWNKTFGETSNDWASSVQETSDGGYIIAGDTWSYGAGVSDFWLVKTDSDGNHEWNKTFGGTSRDSARSVQQTLDGGYILAGETESYGAGSSDAWLVKTDSNGNKEWDKTFGGTDYDVTHSVQQTTDGGYILAGETYSCGAGYADAWLVKTYSDGNEQWNGTFGGTDNDVASSAQQTADGGYILAGRTESYGAGSLDAWLIKLSPEGTTDTTPPTLEITSPAPNTTTHTPTITVAGTASDASGIASVTVNGEPANSTLDWSANVTLSEGENTITVIATDGGEGLNTTKTVTVYRIEPFTFVHITDVHLGFTFLDIEIDDRTETFTESIEKFTDTLQAVKTHNPEFILSPGDLVEYSNNDFFDAYMGILGSLDIPVYNTPGNHDRRGWDPRDDVGLTTYDGIVTNPNDIKSLNDGYRDYYFDKHGYRFIGLDTGADYNVSLPFFLESSNVSTLASHDDFYDSSPEGDGLKDIQLTGLSEMDSAIPKIIFMHHPAVDDSDDESATWSLEPPVTNNCLEEYGGNDACIAFNRCEFIDYCVNNTVDIVLTGHTHKDYIKIVPDDARTHETQFIQTRSATKESEPSQSGFNSHGYRVINVADGENSCPAYLTEETLKKNGIVDRYTFIGNFPNGACYVEKGDAKTGMDKNCNILREIPNTYYTEPLGSEYQVIVYYLFENGEPDDWYLCKKKPVDSETSSISTSQTTLAQESAGNIIINHRTENMTIKYIYEDITLGAAENATASVNFSYENTNCTMEFDDDGDGVTDNVTEPTHIIINHAPEISITTPTGEASGNVTIPHNLKDAESDDCTIMAQYSLDNITWIDATMGEGGDGMINLTSTPLGVDHTFVWASGTDIPQTNAAVYFRIRPYDGDLAGDYATTDAFSVANRGVRGDLNGDGILTPTDAAIALEIAACGSTSCDSATLDAADVSGDHRVTSLDALMILQAAAGRIEL